MRLCRNLMVYAVVILLVAATGASAARTSFRYDAAHRVVKACVLGIGGQQPDTHPNPYVIEGLRRSDLKPDDWVFENPLAPATVRADDASQADYAVKGTRNYWFVELVDETTPPAGPARWIRTTADGLAGMDLIYICAPDLDLTPAQADGLMAAVEAGAVLWVDNDVAGGGTSWTNFPWVFQFDNAGAGGYVRMALDRRHGMLSEPHSIGPAGVSLLGHSPDWRYWEDAGAPPVTGDYITNLDAIFNTVVQVADVGGGGRKPFVVAGSWGSGAVVLTTGGVGLDVSDWLINASSGQTGFTGQSRPSPNPAQAPDVKLALNMIQWNDRWEQARRTPRADATSVARAPFPLDIKWQYPAQTEDPTAVGMGAVVCTPVHDRGLMYIVSQPSPAAGTPARVVCFDVDPERDLNGDRFADDGEGDYGQGAPYDVIWSRELPAGRMPRYASPALATISVPGADYDIPVQVLLVASVDETGDSGWVTCFNATYDETILDQAPAPFDVPGAIYWDRPLPGFNGADVVALSTPVVHNGFVYVLASEFDPGLGGVSPENNTFGRAYCFALNYDWDDDNPDNGLQWVYPSDAPNLDGAGTGSGPEAPRSLPVFHDPTWVSTPGRTPLPPSPGSMPAVYGGVRTADGRMVDALMTFGTAVTHRYDPASGAILIDSSAGGSQYCLVPQPQMPSMPGSIALNADYHVVRTNQAITAYTGTAVADDPTQQIDRAAVLDANHVRYDQAAVREGIIDAGLNPIEAALGYDVIVDHDGVQERVTVPGPVRWRTPLDRRDMITQPPALSTSEVVAAAGQPVPYGPPGAPARGGLTEFDTDSGAVKWSYDPADSMAQPGADPRSMNTTAAAMDAETAIAATMVSPDLWPPTVVSGSIVGLKRQVEPSVHLGPVDPTDAANDALYHISPDAGSFTVELLDGGHVIPPTYYRVDRWNREVIFPAATAGEARIDGVPGRISLFGKAIVVTWRHDEQTFDDVSDDSAPITELHRIPHVERFHHTWGFIRLKYYPVDWTAGVVITRPDGTPIAGHAPASALVAWSGRDLVADGWIDMTAAIDADGRPVLPGDEVLVKYTAWSERDLMWIDVPNANLNIPAERHQMAMPFGPSLGAPAIAGDTVHLGTRGYDPDLDAVFDPPLPGPPARSIDRTMLSLIWDRSSDFVRSSLSRPAEIFPGIPGIPVVESGPSIAEDNVLVGARVLDAPDSPSVDIGYVSALAPWRVLLCDSNRIVETTGSEPSWVCTGTSSPQRAQSFIGEDLKRPFSRPAKATRLPSGGILVVDTGNDRVVEIDRSGRVLWPLDEFGYEYYTSPDNHDLRLSRPADAWRWYEMEIVPGTGQQVPVLYTVVADTGNARVVLIETHFWDPDTAIFDGRQRHVVTTVTPTYVRMGTGPREYERVRYTSAQPIFSPDGSGPIGYLCAAANLNQVLVVTVGEPGTNNAPVVNPFGSVNAPGTDVPWSFLAWLYDDDPFDGEDRSNLPLIFENIKSVRYHQEGGSVFVTVTCSRYRGRVGTGTHPLAQAGPGVFEFEVDVSDADPANWDLAPQSAGPDWPNWYFVAANYQGRPMTTITTAEGTPQERTYDKRWYPVCAQRLGPNRHLIVNGLSQIESATPGNIGSGARNAVLGAHIFEVRTDPVDPLLPDDDVHTLDSERSVPAPGEMWADPFNQPAYAEVR